MLVIILLCLAIICFALDAARVPAGLNWTAAGFAFVTGAALVLSSGGRFG